MDRADVICHGHGVCVIEGGNVVGEGSGEEGGEQGPLVLEMFGTSRYNLFQVGC